MAPLTATVLADADEENAGIASGVNNVIARAAGLLGVAAHGAVIAAQFTGTLRRPARRNDAPLPAGQAGGGPRPRAHAGARYVSGLPTGEAVEIAAATEAAAVSAFHYGMGISAALVGPRRHPRVVARALARAARSAAPAAPGVSSRAPRPTPRASARSPLRVSDHASSDSACARVAAIVSSPRVVRRSSVGSIASPGTTTSRAPRRVA